MKRELLKSILDQMQNKRVLVLGDVMVDEYIWGEVSRISPEAPVPIIEEKCHTYMPGGAANVAMNIQALGGKARIIGLIGDDEKARKLIDTLQSHGINSQGLIVDPSRPTTTKMRVVAHNQQVVRIDRESRENITAEMALKFLDNLATLISEVDAVIVSDYNKGVICSEIAIPLQQMTVPKGRLLLANSKNPNIANLQGCDVLSLNQQEAANIAQSTIYDDSSLHHVGISLLHNLQARTLIITNGKKGMHVFEHNRRVTEIPATEVEVFDVAGAGDTVISTVALAMATGASVLEASILSNYAAGAVIRKLGTATTTCNEILTLYG